MSADDAPKKKAKTRFLPVVKDGTEEFWNPSFVNRARWNTDTPPILVLNDSVQVAPANAAAWCDALGIANRCAEETLAEAFGGDDRAE